MTIRAVIFDLGHTIWDIGSHPGSLEAAYTQMQLLLAEHLERTDLPDAARFQSAVRDVLYAASETYFTDGRELEQPHSTVWVDRACRSLGIELPEALLREITPPLFATEKDSLICDARTASAVALLSERGYRLGCVTNTLADSAAIRTMLAKYQLERLMGSVVVSADEGWRKPHPSLFLKAAAELKTAPQDCVFVGDSPVHDIGGAKAAGMRAVLTRQYVVRSYGVHEVQPDAVIDHLEDLQDVIVALDAVPTKTVSPGDDRSTTSAPAG